MENGKNIALVAQHDAVNENPGEGDIYDVGVLANILQLLKLPDGTVKVLVEGKQRVKFVKVFEEDCFKAQVEPIEAEPVELGETEVSIRTLITEFENYSKVSSKIAPEALGQLKSINELDRLLDTIAGFLDLKLEDKQHLLECNSVSERLDNILSFMESELDMHRVEKKIRGRVKKQMEKSQREYYLNEQMKAIQTELGESEDGQNELDEIQAKIDQAGMPKEAKDKVESELKKLKMMSPMSAEAAVVRNYIDWVVQVPWKKRSRVRSDIEAAQQVLDEDHYGLEKVKERILEYLAVQKRLKKMKGPILCLVGPPGVGKTSLGKSIARATNRKFVRMSLGGVRDEAEIRGHRRTYIGSMPGKIVQNMTKVKTKNPLFLLDEIEKMAADFRGDPASAMLEVLDPEQNNTFADHYLEVDYDLSEVMFVATANSLDIPGPLLDRMEVIRLEGYTEVEKTNIAKKYLLKKQQENNGLKESEISIKDSAILDIIRYYTRESGVRGLEREIAKICRKVTKKLVMSGKLKKVKVDSDNLGATPKDGPSAGIGMCTALISAATNIAVKADVAMTGEITLRGEVLPIGGLKEKLLAAHRGGIKTVIIPHENEKDLVDISDEVRGELTIKPVKWIDEVLEIALAEVPGVILEKKSIEKNIATSDKKTDPSPAARH
ncbi:UNVERIFIED_CONTAM: hypothetical protein GTU68_058070 [Idotea baltica]|nr:hypothetical protein [Idotea baltica]